MKPRKKKTMKPSLTTLNETLQTPVFPQTLHRMRSNPTAAAAKPPKRDNVFSKSRDIREDRGERQIKTTRNAQTLPHGR
jgi:hypothetical protein